MLNPELKAIIDEAKDACRGEPQAMIGYLAQSVLSGRASVEYWKELSREYREERDHAEERLLNGGVK